MTTAALTLTLPDLPATPAGRWANPYGYRCDRLPIPPRPWWRVWYSPTPLFEFALDLEQPLTFVQAGQSFQPNRNYQTDKGSVPRLAQVLIPKDLFERSFLLHDSGYAFGGLHINGTFIQLARCDVDDLLHDAIIAEGGSSLAADVVWAAVRAGGGPAWRKGDRAKA